MQQVHRVCVLSKATKGLMGTATYRALWPIRALNETPHFSNSVVIDHSAVEYMLKTRQLHQMAGYDLYVIQRMPTPPRGARALVGGLRKLGGKAVVFDVDDDITNEHRDVGYDGWMEAVVAECDAVTVSTLALARQMERYGKPIWVLPNHIDTKWFEAVSLAAEKLLGGLVIGTVAGRTHWGDLLLLKDALQRIRQEYPKIVLAVGGYKPPYFEDIEGLKWFAPCPFERLPAMIRQFDIRLCPLDTEDLFNASKSACSLLEAGAAARQVGKKVGGAAVICSDSKQFRRVVQNGHNGLVVKDNDWYTPIKRLIEDRALRQKLQVNALNWAKRNRDISRAGAPWATAYKEILRGQEEKEVL